MKQSRRLLSLILALLFVLAALAGCGGSDGDSESTSSTSGDEGNTPGTVNYTVKVSTAGGMNMEGITCYIHESVNGYMVKRGETDENGIARFDLDPSVEYFVELSGVPDGYNVKDSYTLPVGGTNIVLTSQVIPGTGYSGGYALGDVMHDFTLTTTDGNTVQLSELLKEKKMVMLNFWYVGCYWCGIEFPYLNSAYQKYNDRIEVVAINDYAPDSEAYVASYKEDMDLAFPVVKNNDTLQLSQFSSTGYPTSIFIDRYGVICAIEIGGISSEAIFTVAFDHFVADNYRQQLITDVSELIPVEKPNVTMPAPEKMAEAFDGGLLNAIYSADEEDEYAWPFLITEKDGKPCIYSSNSYKDNSWAILNIDVTLKTGDALLFDYFSSTQRDDYNYLYDVLYVLVDGKDIYSISGVSNEWAVCCPYVATEDGVYTLSFVYYKDFSGYEGEDTVWLSNLRLATVDQIPVETYIYRFAATKLTADGAGYEKYATVVLNEQDGYYHVGNANGPLLLANLLNYSNYDSEHTVFERFYQDDGFTVNGKDCFDRFELYGNYAANSSISGYCTVTEELRTYLEAYTELHRRDVGKVSNENLWLQLCSYYDAYGPDVDQLKDPIKGLAPFSAYEAKLGDDNSVTYDRAILPRGLLYAFTPAESGVYRVTSHSEIEVDGWIFSDEGFVSVGDAPLIAGSEAFERYCPSLHKEDEDGNVYRDPYNVSIVAYLEAGKTYYIDIALYDITAVGSFTFSVEYHGETYEYFREASPGYYTYYETANGGLGGYVIGGIRVALSEEDHYYHELKADGTLGSIVYADFYYAISNVFNYSIREMVEQGMFNFSMTEADVVALNIWKACGENLDNLKERWGVTFDYNYEYYQMADIINGKYHGNGEDYTEIMRGYVDDMLDEPDFPERQGCVAVDETLGNLLQLLMNRDEDPNFHLKNSWTKLCYYYQHLGPKNNG